MHRYIRIVYDYMTYVNLFFNLWNFLKQNDSFPVVSTANWSVVKFHRAMSHIATKLIYTVYYIK